MKSDELKNKTSDELSSLLSAKRVELGKLKFDLVNKKLKDPNQLKKTRKEIARILTMLNFHK